MLIAKTNGEMTGIKYFRHIDQVYDTINTVQLNVGHKKEKVMEAEFKKKFVTLLLEIEVIQIFLK